MKELMASKSYSGVVHSCAMRRQLCNHITNHVGFALFDYANDNRVLLALKILTFLINFPSRKSKSKQRDIRERKIMTLRLYVYNDIGSFNVPVIHPYSACDSNLD